MEQEGDFFFEADPRVQEFKGDDQFEHFKNKFTHYFTNTVTILRKQTSKACASKYAYTFIRISFSNFSNVKLQEVKQLTPNIGNNTTKYMLQTHK